MLAVRRLSQVARLRVCCGPRRSLCRILLSARVSRVGPVDHTGRRSQVHVARAFLALDILVDILDVRYHGVLTRRELVGWTTLLVRLGGHLSRDGSLLLLLHGGLSRARTTTERTETHRC